MPELMRYTANNNILRTLIGWIPFAGLITLIACLIIWLASLLLNFEFRFLTIGIVFLVVFSVFALLTLYINLQVKRIDISSDGILRIKYYEHRNQTDTVVRLSELSNIKVTTTIKGYKFFQLERPNNAPLSIDLTAIPERELRDLANQFNFNISFERTLD